MSRYFPYFYHAQMRKYASYFATVFNEIEIERKDKAGASIQRMLVPLAYAPRDKALARQDEEPDFNERKAAIFYPRMTYDLMGISYDPDRKLGRGNQVLDSQTGAALFAPAPWNMNFDLTVAASSVDDANQVVEQILGMFNSEITATLEILPGVCIDVPLILEGVSKSDNWQGTIDSRREINWTLNFSMKGLFFGPIATRKVIKFIDAGTHFNQDDSTGEHVQMYPGVDASGNPTTDPAQAIDWNLVNSQDDWGFVVQVTDEE